MWIKWSNYRFTKSEHLYIFSYKIIFQRSHKFYIKFYSFSTISALHLLIWHSLWFKTSIIRYKGTIFCNCTLYLHGDYEFSLIVVYFIEEVIFFFSVCSNILSKELKMYCLINLTCALQKMLTSFHVVIFARTFIVCPLLASKILNSVGKMRK